MADDTFVTAKFSTGKLPLREGVMAYRDMLSRTVGTLDVEAIGEHFEFSTHAMALPGLGIARITSSALRVGRTLNMPVDAGRDLIFAVMHQGSAWREQRGREVSVDGSGGFLSSIHDALMMQRTAGQLTNYSLARRDLAVADLDRAMRSPTPVDSEAMRLLSGYTDLLFANYGLSSPGSRRLAISHIYDLIALALGATRDATESAKTRGLRAARSAELYARASRLIALRFDDPDLAPAAMANQLRVSPRLLQKVFAERGDTIMARLWEERVTRAAGLLSALDAADRSITDIAFACGFNDSSHFGRVFAARMGMTPSRWRKQAHDEVPPVVMVDAGGNSTVPARRRRTSCRSQMPSPTNPAS
jgi:AraC-like DNA-binding protein